MLRHSRVFSALCSGLLAVLIATGSALSDGFPVGPCGSAPPAKPQHRKGGESVPPLPLPATPLRRTEKKRPPSPPPLIAKIQFSGLKEVSVGGQAIKYYDWNKDPGDAPMLLNLAGRVLSINYTYRQAPLSVLEADPAQYPIYYFTGSDKFTLTEDEITKIRTFVVNGGTVWGDSCYGDPAFFKAFIEQMGRVFPDRPFKQLPESHPLFHCFYDIDEIAYNMPVPDAPSGKGKPILFGIDFGCRTAIILDRYGMSCGWDGHIRQGAHTVSPNDARKIGVNMIAYTLGYFKLGQYDASTKVFYDESERARGDFVFGQVAYPGNWDPHPNGTANLLREVATKTSAEVKFKRRAVKLDSPDMLDYPFLYLTGHDDFKLTDKEVEQLRRYLLSGGFLFADACCGSPVFDAAFRREIARVLPTAKLQKLPADHAVYSVLYKMDKLHFTDYTQTREPDRAQLDLEGITIEANTVVIYSRLAVGTGWRGFDIPFCNGLAADDSLKMGVNIVVYSMTH